MSLVSPASPSSPEHLPATPAESPAQRFEARIEDGKLYYDKRWYVVGEKHRVLERVSNEPLGKRAGPARSCRFRAWLPLTLRHIKSEVTFKRESGVVRLSLIVRSRKAVFSQNMFFLWCPPLPCCTRICRLTSLVMLL